MSLLLTGAGVNSTVSAGPFSPSSLSPSLWIDPSQSGTMFQSNAGTTAVTNGSVCGYAGDVSGNARHLTSANNDNSRPTWNDSGGLQWLSFQNDGTVNDVLRRTTALGLYAGGSGNSIFVAVKANPAANAVMVGDTATSNASPLYAIGSGTVTATTMRSIIVNDAATNLSVLSTTNVFDNTVRVLGFTDSTTSVTNYSNQTAGTPTGYTRSGTVTADRFCLGADITVVTAGFFNMLLYGLVIVPRELNSTEITALVTWLGAKGGLTI